MVGPTLGGWLSDKLGGAKVTFWNFVGMACFATLALIASQQKSFGLAVFAFCGLFFTAGLGNGSTYKMIPAIFRSKAVIAKSEGTAAAVADRHARRMSGALIGIAGAIGAGGGVLVNIAFRQSFLHNHNGNAAYLSFLVFYALCFVVTYVVYLKPGARKLANI